SRARARLSCGQAARRLLVVVGQERRGELGRGALVVAAGALGTRASFTTIAAFTPRGAVPIPITTTAAVASTALTARSTITVASAAATMAVAAVTARSPIAALARFARRTG